MKLHTLSLCVVAVAICSIACVAGQAANAGPGDRVCDGGKYGSVAVSASESYDGKAGCVRYTKGWDVTGTTNFKQIIPKDLCGCISYCKANARTCAGWVWKYVDNTMAGGVPARKCTIYSNLNMPPDTTLGLDAKTSMLANVGGPMPIPATGFVQGGGFVPHCQMPPFDANGNGKGWDRNCFSGQLWILDDNTAATAGNAMAKKGQFSC